MLGGSFQSLAMASFEALREIDFETEAQEVDEAARKNDLADGMLAESRLLAGFAVEFLAMLDDPAQGQIWHNYILQKLDTLYLHPDAAEQREQIMKRLWAESRSPTPTFAGTALMTLLRLHEERPDVVKLAKLSNRAEWVVVRDAYTNSDRLSALHVLSATNEGQAKAVARIWLDEPDCPILLKNTAIAVLGQQLKASDIALIQAYRDHADFRLRSAALNALLN